MLVLTFRLEEDAVITLPDGREIGVVFLGLGGYRSRQARMGFIADPDIIIDRRAIYERKLKEQLVNGNVAEVAP
jgi:sRNA-binding carbon storage regulator CsrA